MNKSLPLLDAPERERAANDLSTTLLVEAAAGTGKTTLLVQRILAMLRDTTTPIARIAAITFTEKAAGELKLRIRQAIEGELAQGRDNEEGHLARALTELDRMTVGTIHSFCRELLRDHAIHAALDPDFSVIDKGVAQALWDDTWIGWLREELELNPQPVSDLLDAGIFVQLPGCMRFVESVASFLFKQRAGLEQLHVPAPSESDYRSELHDYLQAVAEQCAIAEECRTSEDTLAAQIAAVRLWLAKRPQSTVDVLRWLLSAPRLHGGRKGRVEFWPRQETLLALREFFLRGSSDYNAGRERVCTMIASLLCAPLVSRLKDFVRAQDDVKEQLGSLDFDDLLIHTRNVLRDQPVVREQIKQRFDYLLVDEFQDTDPLQTEIVFFCAERNERTAASWLEVELEHGKLFIVGDPKQSIYRFRRADIALYKLVREKIAACGAVLTIRVNFRSHPAILEEVNTIFSALAANNSSVATIDYVPLAAPPELREWSLPPLTFLTPRPDFDPRTLKKSEAATQEAGMIAAEIARSVERGDFAFRDCAIIFERRTRLSELQAALRACNIPFETIGGREYGQRQEILWLRTLLEAIFNPYDAQAVVGALRLPILGVPDPDLAEYRAQAADFNYLHATAKSPALKAGFQRLNEYHELAAVLSPAVLLDQLYERTVLLSLAALLPNGERRVANLRYARELAAILEQQGNGSLADFIRQLRRFEQFPTEFDDPIVAEHDDNVVTLLTCHRAKGLEFPVVFLYRLGQTVTFKTRAVLPGAQNEMELLLSVDVRTTGLDRAYQAEFAEQKQESMRLLYVALTRAKSALYIPAIFERGPATEGGWSLAGFLEPRYPLDATGKPTLVDSGFRLLECPLAPAVVPNEHAPLVGEESAAPAHAISDRSGWRQQLRRAQGKLNSRQFDSNREHFAAAKQAIDAESEAAMQIGSAVHRILERIDFSRPLTPEQAHSLLRKEGILSDGLLPRAAQLVSTALASADFVNQCLAAERIWRELPFACEIDGVVQEGVIDLLLQSGDQLTLVDYKTDLVAGAELTIRVEQYRPQLAAYVTAIRAVFPRRAVSCHLFFLHTGQLIPVTP